MMNTQCIKCRDIRMCAVMRGHSANPFFTCAKHEWIRRTHLMPGPTLDCIRLKPNHATILTDDFVPTDVQEEK